MLRISPSPSATPHPPPPPTTRHPPPATAHLSHILNIRTNWWHRPLRRQITIELFLGKHRRFTLQLPNSQNVKWKGDLNEELYSMCKKLSFIGDLLGTFWRSLLKKNRTALSSIGLVYTNTVEHNTLTSLLQLSVSFHKFYRAIFYQHQLHFRVQLEATFVVTYLFWEHK